MPKVFLDNGTGEKAARKKKKKLEGEGKEASSRIFSLAGSRIGRIKLDTFSGMFFFLGACNSQAHLACCSCNVPLKFWLLLFPISFQSLNISNCAKRGHCMQTAKESPAALDSRHVFR
jgi:hypothetical protein